MPNGVYYLLCLILVHFTDACEKKAGINTFGPECQYMCHCVNGERCDVVSGDCDNGCEPKWFGPGCQFRDVAYDEYSRHNNNTSPARYADLGNDGDTSSCSYTNNASESTTEPWWRVWLPRNETIHELTILTNDDGKDYLSNFTVTVEYVQSTEKENNYYIPEYRNICYRTTSLSIQSTYMHVLCKDPIVGNQIRIQLNQVKTQLVLCDVRINGGRNMAYARNVNVSSRFDKAKFKPGKAVNGVLTNTTWEYCFVSGDIVNNWISIDLGQHIHVTSINITKFNDKKLKHYIIEVSNTSMTSSWEEVYEDSPNNTLTTQVSLSVTTRYLRVRRPAENRFVICELQIFGSCPSNKCGYDCSNDCHCKGNEPMKNKINGVCSTGCSARWTGTKDQCDINACEKRAGIDTFGPECQYMCHCVNGQVCDVFSGDCENGCEPKWFGPGCQFRDVAYAEYSRHISNTSPARYSILGNDGNDGNTNNARESTAEPWWRVWLPRNETIHELTILTNDDGKDYLSNFTVTVEFVDSTEMENFNYVPKYRNICYRTTTPLMPSTYIHVLCEEPIVGNQIRIQLNQVKTQLILCDVRINGGRNMAYARKVNVSSRFDTAKFGPGKAVDGVLTNTTWENCFVSGNNTNNWITIDIGQQIYVTSINITKYNDNKLKNYIIEVTNTSNANSWEKVYDDSPNNTLTTQVSLSVTTRYLRVRRPNENRFIICELQIFGRCPSNTCGYGCSNECHCRGIENLENKISGVCSTGCSGRWTGTKDQCNINSVTTTDIPLAPIAGAVSSVVAVAIVVVAVIVWRRRKRLRSEPNEQIAQSQEFGVHEDTNTTPGDANKTEHTYEIIVL